MPTVMSDRQQFSIVSNLINHRNDVKMFKTQVEPWAACEWFNCQVLNISFICSNINFSIEVFLQKLHSIIRRKTNCAIIRSFLLSATLVKLSSWPISAWKRTQFMVKCYIFPFYSLYSLFLVLWAFCFLHCLMIPVQHTCQCMSSLVYLFLHLLLEPFSWESMKNFSSPSKSPLFLLNLLFNLHSCTGPKLNVAWGNSHHLAMLLLVSPPNDVWETSAEIPYWWCVITQIWVVLLIGRAAWEIYFSQSEALPRSG